MHFEQPAAEWTPTDLVDEVEHCRLRIKKFEQRFDAAVEKAPASIRAVIDAFQALRGVAKLGVVTLVAEVGSFSRFPSAWKFMGYSGSVSSEYSSGEKTCRRGITKAGNAHIRRLAGEAAFCQRFRPFPSRALKERQDLLSPAIQEIAARARRRIHERLVHLLAKGKSPQKA